MRVPPALCTWLPLLTLFALAGCSRTGNSSTGLVATSSPAPSVEPTVPTQDLLMARSGFQTKLIPNSYKPDSCLATPPAGVFERVRYVSPAGELAALVTSDPGDGKKHPALVWCHGGFGGIGEAEWKEDGDTAPFRRAGLIVMCPSWRGECDNPGSFELFFGEVEDVIAAIDYVAKLSYVDPNRIYLSGHSTGGTLTLLTVAATRKVRAAFSFGGCPDVENLMNLSRGVGYQNTPYDYRDAQESRLRSAIRFVGAIQTPTFFFEGDESALYCNDALRMEQQARRGGVPFRAYVIEGGDHFNILRPFSELIVAKIRSDTGAQCGISFTPDEIRRTLVPRKRKN